MVRGVIYSRSRTPLYGWDRTHQDMAPGQSRRSGRNRSDYRLGLRGSDLQSLQGFRNRGIYTKIHF